MSKANSFFLIVTLVLMHVLISCKDSSTNKPTSSKTMKLYEQADTLANTFWDYNLTFDERAQILVDTLTLEEKLAQMVYDAPAIPRLGIPAYNWWNEALHGIARFGRATIFPQPIGMAATFDRNLIFNIADVISTEGRAKHKAAVDMGYYSQYGGLTYWSPNVNIFRDPRWGRGMETWGEDPHLTGTLGTAFVKGLQGDDPKYLKSAACAKHYAVHSGPEAERHHYNAMPSKRDLRETYLPAFEQLVTEGDVEAIMCAYTRLYGDPCCGSDFLLQELLIDEWGFDGHILSDCWAINDFHINHKVAGDQAESAAMAIEAGVHLNCGDAYDSLMVSFERGLIDENQIDVLLQRLLLTRFELGLFDPDEMVPFQYDASVINSEEHQQVARKAAQKSVVLLKNNGMLPLDPAMQRLYVMGPMAANVDAMIGNYPGVSENIVTILEGITGAISPGTRMEYRKGFFMDRDNINKTGWAISEATESPATIVVMGINNELEGEEGESIASPTKSDRVNLELPPNQLDYLRQIRENDGKPLIVVMTGGSPIEIQEVYELADALVWAWYPGEQGGHGVADVLFGKVSPSGKLPITFPRSVDQLPAYDDYTMMGRTYKYMDKEPLFPFGFGLSYTSFSYDLSLSSATISEADSTLSASVTVTNIGEMDSEEVIQLYFSPKEKSESLPLYKLIAFTRVKVPAGQSVTENIEIPISAFEFFDEEGKGYIAKGDFTISAGGSLPSDRSYTLGATKAKSVNLTIQ